MQWMWKQWLHCPHTRGQSSPANLQSGQQPSKATLQMPHVSSLASHFQTATPDQERMLTLSLVGGRVEVLVVGEEGGTSTVCPIQEGSMAGLDWGCWFSIFSVSIISHLL